VSWDNGGVDAKKETQYEQLRTNYEYFPYHINEDKIKNYVPVGHKKMAIGDGVDICYLYDSTLCKENTGIYI